MSWAVKERRKTGRRRRRGRRNGEEEEEEEKGGRVFRSFGMNGGYFPASKLRQAR
jgi:hypothetical protein